MLNCVYHAVDEMRVVNNDEREKLLATGVWFDSPGEAKSGLKPNEKPILSNSKSAKCEIKSEDRSNEK